MLDRLLVAACIAGVALAYAGEGLAWAVPVGVVLPWLLLRARQPWLGLLLAAINVAFAIHRGLDQRGIISIGLAWVALGAIWLHDRRWLARVMGGLLACWLVVGAAMLLSSRVIGIPEPEMVATSGPWVLAGGAIVALLLGLACRVRPDPWGSSLLPGAADGFGNLTSPDHSVRSSLAIGLTAGVTAVAWLFDRTAGWAVALALAVLLPWVALRTVHVPLASVLVLGLLAERSYRLIAGLDTAAPDGGWWLTAIALLWSGYLIGWLHNRGLLPWLLGLAAIGTAVALSAAITGIAPDGSWKAETALLLALAVLTGVAWRLRPGGVSKPRGRSSWDEAGVTSRRDRPLRLTGDDLGSDATRSTANEGALRAGLAAEDEMFEYLLRALPAGTCVLKSLTLPDMHGDLDVLVIGRSGLLVVEVKYWAGEIWCSGDGHAWTRRKRGVVETMRDPAGQASGCVRGLRSYLEQVDRGLCARASGSGSRPLSSSHTRPVLCTQRRARSPSCRPNTLP
jgi:hypothetical protein